MKIHFDLQHYHVNKPAITTGVFDGVHKGHIEIISRLKQAAASIQGESVVVTFWPHPRLVLNLDPSIKLLNTLDEKLSLLEKSGVEHVVVVPFTDKFAKQSSEEFVVNELVNRLNVKHLIVGFNHHFGKGREGNFDLMQSYAHKYGFAVEKLDAQLVDNEKVSSTLIRKALSEGDTDTAASCLGYDYRITGKVVEGNRIGRTIGFPTANIKLNHSFKLIPKEGVYAVEVDIEGKLYPGMLNMGYRPTLEELTPAMSIEVHIIGFEGDLYEKEITLYFKKRIRDEMKFDGIELLKQQLRHDKGEVIKILGV